MSIDARTEEIVMPSNSGGCMRDLHVVSLSYSLKHGDDVTYDSPPPVVFETPEAEFLLTDAGLSCRMKIHFATTKEARAVVEPVLRAWEVDADLRRGKVELRFKFVSTEVVDRSPTPPGTLRGRVLHTDAGEFLVITDSASSSVTRRKYPEPPGDFRVSPDVETLYHRFQGYRDGKEPLLAMAYFCLTVLKTSSGGRHKAATKYKIDESVVKKLGELSSTRGDSHTARKMVASPMRSLSDIESTWIEEAIKKIIWRLGDHRPLAALPMITIADLPSL